MAAPTAEQKQSWPAPNYENPDNLHGLVIGFTVPVLTLAIICESPILQIIDPITRKLILLVLSNGYLLAWLCHLTADTFTHLFRSFKLVMMEPTLICIPNSSGRSFLREGIASTDSLAR